MNAKGDREGLAFKDWRRADHGGEACFLTRSQKFVANSGESMGRSGQRPERSHRLRLAVERSPRPRIFAH